MCVIPLFSGLVTAHSETNPDATYTFSLPPVYQELFSLRTRPGDTTVADLIAPWPFDFESLSSHNVVIQAVSNNNGTAMEHFTINVSFDYVYALAFHAYGFTILLRNILQHCINNISQEFKII